MSGEQTLAAHRLSSLPAERHDSTGHQAPDACGPTPASPACDSRG